MMRPLDFLLISDDMQYDVKFCKKLTAIQNDNSPKLVHVFSLKEEQSQARGYWKFNNSLIKDKHFVESLKSYIKSINFHLMIQELTGNFLSTKVLDSQKDMQRNKQKRRKPGDHH